MAARGDLEPIEPSVAAAEEGLVSASKSHDICREIAESDPRSCLLRPGTELPFPSSPLPFLSPDIGSRAAKGTTESPSRLAACCSAKTRCCRASEGSGGQGIERCTTRIILIRRRWLTSFKTWSTSGPSSRRHRACPRHMTGASVPWRPYLSLCAPTQPSTSFMPPPFGLRFGSPSSGAAYALFKRANHLRIQAAPVTSGDRGARVNSISAGIILRPLAREEMSGPGAQGYRAMVERSAAGRVGTTDEVATAAAYLLGRTPDSSRAPIYSSTVASSPRSELVACKPGCGDGGNAWMPQLVRA